MVDSKPNRRARFTGYPTGWFVIAFSDELEKGTVVPKEYFGRIMALYRSESGELGLLDTYCAHLGASLAHGGVVKGDRLECPFHVWRYDATGQCVEIPYAKKIPKKACVQSWPVVERSGLVLMWHDSKGGKPEYELPEMEEWESSDWTRWTMSCLRIKTHPKEIVENVVDKAHFPTVHNTHVESFENEFDGHKAIQRTAGVAYPVGGGEDRFNITATYFGPGIQISWMEGYVPARLVNAHTPVDETSVDLRFGVMLKMVVSKEKTKKFAEAYAENLRLGFHQDIAIWEHKKYRDVPVLCDGDGPIMKLRQWYAQFYDQSASPNATEAVDAAE